MEVIQRESEDKNKANDIHLMSTENPKSAITEAYRAIRTNIKFSRTADGRECVKTILFTSAMKHAGKSTTVANLAMVMAQAGSKVLLVDADLRNPCIHRLFHLRKVGLTNVLAGGVPVEQCIQYCGQENLHLLATGPAAPKPSELLSLPVVDEFLADVRAKYDYVLIDMPPIMPVTDAAVMGARVDGVVLVLECGVTRPEVDVEAMRRMEQAGSHIIGAIMNKVEVDSKKYQYLAGYGYGYGYGYGDGYGYGYEEDELDEATVKRQPEKKAANNK